MLVFWVFMVECFTGLNLKSRCVVVALLVLFCAFCSTSLFVWHAGTYWHDQQRVGQLVFVIACALLLPFFPQQALQSKILVLLLSFFVFGFFSSLQAEWPEWAFKEWARYAGLMLVAMLFASIARRYEVKQVVLWGMLFVGVVHVYLFLVVYVISYASGVRALNSILLAPGFTNPRFFGQFQVIVVPVIAAFVLGFWSGQRKVLSGLLCLVLVLQWAISFSLGGRGLWLGLVVAYSVVCLVAIRYWRMALLQLLCGALGFFVFLFMFEFVPYLLGLEVKLIEGGRADLSGRDVIWHAAWDMVIANPWLGVGPMHFAATYNVIAAHPHQVILQLLSEWGSLAGASAIALGALVCVRALSYLRQTGSNDEDAAIFTAIGGALILAQVDGVFVMPYTETWFALLVGLALARWAIPAPALKVQRIFLAVLAVAVVLIMSRVLIKEVPELLFSNKSQVTQSLSVKPRFWVHGWIPNITEASSSE